MTGWEVYKIIATVVGRKSSRQARGRHEPVEAQAGTRELARPSTGSGQGLSEQRGEWERDRCSIQLEFHLIEQPRLALTAPTVEVTPYPIDRPGDK